MAGSRPLVEVVTVATQAEDPSGKGGHLHLLENSCRACGLELTVLGLGQEWKGFGLKLTLVEEYLQGVPDDAIILFADAYDVLMIADAERIAAQFRGLDCPLVFSAEIECWPRRDLAGEFPAPFSRRQQTLDSRVRRVRPPPPKVLPSRYLNSGGYIGYAGAVREAIRELSPKFEDDDQGLFTLYFLRNQDKVTLDYEGAIFLSLHAVPGLDLRLTAGPSPTLYYSRTGTYPCLLHGNGGGILTLHRIHRELQAAGWPGSGSPR